MSARAWARAGIARAAAVVAITPSERRRAELASPGRARRLHDRWRHGAWFPSGRGAALMPLVGYATPSVERGAKARRDVRAQTTAIAAECDRRGLALLETVRERGSRRPGAAGRPGLGRALQRILDGEAQGLVVSDLSRLGDSVSELGRVLEWFLGSDIRLIAASPRLDTDGEAGRLAVRTVIELSRREHERLVERTRVGMQAARRKGPPAVADQPALRERITRMRAEGMTLQGIADRLNAEGVPTVRGGAKWRTSSVQTAVGYQRRSARSRDAGASKTAAI